MADHTAGTNCRASSSDGGAAQIEEIIPGVPEATTLYVTFGDSLYRGGQPRQNESGSDWRGRADKIGHDGWERYTSVCLSPAGKLYAALPIGYSSNNNTLWVASPPRGSGDKWDGELIGGKGWEHCKFMFFDSTGALFAVDENGQLLKGPPPTSEDEAWLEKAEVIGLAGWDSFRFLFCHPSEQTLYAVLGETMYRGSIPSGTSDNWVSRAQGVGADDWRDFKHLFFSQHGTLYGNTVGGELYAAKPPTSATDNWRTSVVCVGTGMHLNSACAQW